METGDIGEGKARAAGGERGRWRRERARDCEIGERPDERPGDGEARPTGGGDRISRGSAKHAQSDSRGIAKTDNCALPPLPCMSGRLTETSRGQSGVSRGQSGVSAKHEQFDSCGIVSTGPW
jgi:hypothetical protein